MVFPRSLYHNALIAIVFRCKGGCTKIMGGHVFAEIVKISDKDTPAHRNTDTFNVLFPGVGVGFGVGVGVGGKFP